MGSNPSKRSDFNSLDETNSSSEASSRTSTLVRRKKRRTQRNGDALSIASTDSRVSSVDVSLVPNRRLVDDVHPGKDGDSTPERSLRISRPLSHYDVESLNGIEPNSFVQLRRVSKLANGYDVKPAAINGASCEVDCNDNRLRTGGGACVACDAHDADDVTADVQTSHPDSGANYNGGGALPRRDTAQDTLSRLVKNGFVTSRKSCLKLVYECSRDDNRKKLSQLCDVAFLDSGQIAVSTSALGTSGLQVCAVDDPTRSGSLFGEPFLNAPRGIATGPGSCVAVTDWKQKTVNFLTTDGQFLDSWKTNKFKHPGGIAVNRDGRYVVADLSRKESAIGLYTPFGKLLRRFGADHFDWPWYVAVDHKNRILVSERKSGVVSVFDDVGRFLFKFGGAGSATGTSARSDGQLNCPGGITVNCQNDILVADTDNHRVALFSPDGAFISNLVTMRTSRPVSVDYCDGHLAVVTDDDLRVYKTYVEKTAL